MTSSRVGALFLVFVSCGGEDTRTSAGEKGETGISFSGSDGETSFKDSGSDDGDDDETKLDLGEASGDGCVVGGKDDAALSGTIFAPNGTLPVAGALVYVSAEAPEGIPDGVYCANCVELECGTDFVETDAQGNFSLTTSSGAGKYLVVQKGQFMRVQSFDVPPGATKLPDAFVELPDRWSPEEGLYIPRIAIGDGVFDRLEDAFGKFGLGETLIEDFEERTVPGTEQFDLYENGWSPAKNGFVSHGTMTDLVSSPDKLAQYHIVFVPCSSDAHSEKLTPQSIENIRSWVAAGGRWYVADWSNEFLAKVFPEYQTFYSDAFGADLHVFDSRATVLDAGLLSWLKALPDPLKDINPLNDEPHPTLFELPDVVTTSNWSGIQYPLPEIFVEDGMGGQVNVGYKVWLEGPGDGEEIPKDPPHPLTVTGQYGCGKIQFTSYHMAELFNYVGLSPQELVLIYTILEIGVCQADLPTPEG